MTKKLIKISKYRPSIFQSAFEFEDLRRGASLAMEHPLESGARSVLIGLILVLVCGYLYFVSASVLNVIARKEAIASIASIQGSIGTLEQSYLTISQAVTPARGAALGLAPVSGTQYVYRQGNVGAATIRSNEI